MFSTQFIVCFFFSVYVLVESVLWCVCLEVSLMVYVHLKNLLDLVHRWILDYAELMGLYSEGVYGGGFRRDDSLRDVMPDGGSDIGLWLYRNGGVYRFVFRRFASSLDSDQYILGVLLDILRDSFYSCFSNVRIYGIQFEHGVYVVNRIWLSHGDFRFFGFILFMLRYWYVLFFYRISGGGAVGFVGLLRYWFMLLNNRTYFLRNRLVDFLFRLFCVRSLVRFSRFVINNNGLRLVRHGVFVDVLGNRDDVSDCNYFRFVRFLGFWFIFGGVYVSTFDVIRWRFLMGGTCFGRVGFVRGVRRLMRGELGVSFFI